MTLGAAGEVAALELPVPAALAVIKLLARRLLILEGGFQIRIATGKVVFSVEGDMCVRIQGFGVVVVHQLVKLL